MGREMRQFRYYKEGEGVFSMGGNSVTNYFPGATVNLVNENDPGLSVDLTPYGIVQLGIQTVPGTRIKFNHSINPVVIGYSGIYELNLEQSAGVINQFSIDYNSMQIINDLPNGFFIMDIVYNKDDTVTLPEDDIKYAQKKEEENG